MRRLKILISAYACEPDKGSEPWTGWNWAVQMAQFHDVWVLTRENNRPSIERAMRREAIPSIHWMYVDLPRWGQFWKKGTRGMRLYYVLWQTGAYFVAKRLHREVHFDLVHHITWGNYWLPSLLVFLPVRFVWGPVGGGESVPPRLRAVFSLRGRLFEFLRQIGQWGGEHGPFVKRAAKRVCLALATTPETAARLRYIGCRRVQVMPRLAIQGDEWVRLQTLPVRTGPPFRLVSIGRLLEWKGFHLGLLAFAQLQQQAPESEYWIIGNGPQHRRLVSLARRLGVHERVQFFGNLPRQQVLAMLAECDVLVHPSLHDSGGWVCLEAMAAGRPVICLDVGGPAVQVTDRTGIKVAPHGPQQVVQDLAAAMHRLAHDLSLRWDMGEEGRRRVGEDYVWHKKSVIVARLYEEILAEAEEILAEAEAGAGRL